MSSGPPLPVEDINNNCMDTRCSEGGYTARSENLHTKLEQTQQRTRAVTTQRGNYFLRRDVKPTNFLSLESPDEDYFLYCDECNEEYDGDCPVHGPMNYIHDTEVTNATIDGAIKSLPAGLAIKPSGIPKAGLGVWTLKKFPKRTVFGPYGGEIVTDQLEANESGYAWQILEDGKLSHFVDGKDPSRANWLRYINCASTEAEQQLVAFQHRGQIFYRAYKHIPANTELLVWYGSGYIQETRALQENTPLIRPTDAKIQKAYPCVSCKTASDSTLAAVTNYARHLVQHHPHEKGVRQLHTWLNTVNIDNQFSNLGNQSSTEMSEMENCSEGPTEGMETTTNGHTPTDSQNDCDTVQTIFTNDLNKDSRIQKDYCPDIFPVVAAGFKRKLSFRKEAVSPHHRMYKCDLCDETFTKEHDLTAHVTVHKSNNSYKCTICGKCFKRSSNLQCHQRIHTTDDSTYVCDKCDKHFTCYSSLERHQEIHATTGKTCKTVICSERVPLSSKLQQQQKIHYQNENTYTCDICEKVFTCTFNLQRHQKSHTPNHKLYTCDICNKNFTCKFNVVRHKNMHKPVTGDRSYNGVHKQNINDDSSESPTSSSSSSDSFKKPTHSQSKGQIQVDTGNKLYDCDEGIKQSNVSPRLQTNDFATSVDRNTGTTRRNLETRQMTKINLMDVNDGRVTDSGMVFLQEEVYPGDSTGTRTLQGHRKEHTCTDSSKNINHISNAPLKQKYDLQLLGHNENQMHIYKDKQVNKVMKKQLRKKEKLHKGKEKQSYKCNNEKLHKYNREKKHKDEEKQLHKHQKCDVCGKTFKRGKQLHKHRTNKLHKHQRH